jgi:hypothetical protein
MSQDTAYSSGARAIAANIRQGWKCVAVTNEMLYLPPQKKFYEMG